MERQQLHMLYVQSSDSMYLVHEDTEKQAKRWKQIEGVEKVGKVEDVGKV